MTKEEEAIEWFTMLKEKFTGTEYGEYLDMAIRSLDVGDVVKAEIDAYLIENEFGTAYRQEIADIIDKHLREVENGRNQEF